MDPKLKAKNERILERLRKWEMKHWYGRSQRGPVRISPIDEAWMGNNSRGPKLSAREEIIRREMALGTPREEIAKKVSISLATLDTAIHRINKKFQGKM